MLNKSYKYVLASGSPRRRELLAGLGIDFSLRLLPDIDESYPEGLTGEEIAQTISQHKAEAYRPTLQADELLITADTIVYLDGQVLGKPHSLEEAKEMLRQLSGKTHEVITGITLLTQQQTKTFATTTKVRFKTLEESEIDYYVEHYKPLDKAGAYGIQEWIGYVGVEYIEGSYYNVMGLPVQRLYREIKQLRVK